MHSLLSLCLIAALIRAANFLHVRGDLSIDLDSKCILLSANSSQLRPMTGHTPPPILLSLSQEQTERFASLIENLSGLAYSTLCQQSGSISTDSQFSGYVQSDSCRRRHSVLLAGADEVELSSPIKNRPRSLQPTEACLQNSGESSPCEDGFERAIILLENPFEALWRSLRKSNVKFQRREDVAFLNAEATKRAQQAVIQTAESLSKSWYDHINIILQGLRPEQLYLIKIESILNAVIARRMDLFENLLHFIDSTIQMDRVSCAAQTSTRLLDGDRGTSKLVSMNKVMSKRVVCKLRQLFRFANEFNYLLFEEVRCEGDVNLPSSLLQTQAYTSIRRCKAKYDDRDFLPHSKMRLPPVLFTFPGSGNTYSRLLLEFATGVYSGSIYADRSLKKLMPGERACGQRTCVVKIHPGNIRVEIDDQSPPLRPGRIFPTLSARLCQRGMIKSFDKVIFLLRDPFRSIWSEYQRMRNSDHVGAVKRNQFDRQDWETAAVQLSVYYKFMFEKEIDMIVKGFFPTQYLFVLYEDLIASKSRISTLQKILHFMSFDVSLEKIECAFHLSERPEIHRSSKTAEHIQIQEVYRTDLVCIMWDIIGPFAKRFKYKIWGNVDCQTVNWKVSNITASLLDHNTAREKAKARVEKSFDEEFHIENSNITDGMATLGV